MLKLVFVITTIFGLLFTLRLYQLDGFDTEYRDPEISTFKSIRDSLSQVIKTVLPEPQASLLSAMVIGQANDIPFKFKKDLQVTSTIHLLVVSGQNLSILAGFLMNLVYVFGRRKTAVLTIVAVVLYSLLTGLGVPVIRAAIMASCSLFAQVLGREVKGWFILILSAGLMILYNPNWLFSISFQLSFLATIGVVVISPILINHLYFIPKIIKEDLAVTISAYFLTLPVIVYNFHQLSIVGIITNILILWTSPLIMISGVITIIISLVSQTIGTLVGLIPTLLLTYFIYIVEFFANFTSPVILIGQTTLVFWSGYYLLMVGLILYLHIKALKVRIHE